MSFAISSFSLVGGRSMNQDAFLTDLSSGIFVVADGIGGGEEGDIAACLSVETVGQLKESQSLLEAFELAQKAVYNLAIEKYGTPIVGTTLTAVRSKKDGSGFELCHIGDSRCYLVSGKELTQISVDHEEFDDKAGGNVLVRYIGMESPGSLPVQRAEFDVTTGDVVLLCTDGLHRQITTQEIVDVIEHKKDDWPGAARFLCELAADVTRSDNVTVILIRIE